MLLFLVLFISYLYEVKFVRRQANIVDHTSARAVCSWASHRIFIIILLVLNIG